MTLQPGGTDVSFGIPLEVLNRVVVALGLLHITQRNLSSITWEFFINTEVHVIISSHVNLQGSKSKVKHLHSQSVLASWRKQL